MDEHKPLVGPSAVRRAVSHPLDTLFAVKRLIGRRFDEPEVLALASAAALWVFLFRTRAGFALQVGGLAPAAARYF